MSHAREDSFILHALAPLLERTEILLSYGGDDRLTVDGKLINKYLSSTYPRPEVLRRGSCTCSTITTEVNHMIYYPLTAENMINSILAKKRTLSVVQGKVKYSIHSFFTRNTETAIFETRLIHYFALCRATMRLNRLEKSCTMKFCQNMRRILRDSQTKNMQKNAFQQSCIQHMITYAPGYNYC